MKRFILLLLLFLAGCSTTPIPCEVKVKGECRDITPGERAGSATRGHGETKEIQP